VLWTADRSENFTHGKDIDMTRGKRTALVGAVVLGSVGVMTVVGCTGADDEDDVTVSSALKTPGGGG
jgi:hypothetical protein